VSPFPLLALFTFLLVLGALTGGALPVVSRTSARRLQLFLAGSAGVMLGVVGSHLLPEAFVAGPSAAWAVVGGFVFMMIVERFVLPHALHSADASEAHAQCDPAVEAQHVRAEAAGVGAFVGLALHTLGDGFALGAALENPSVAKWVFAAILAHKVPSAFALGSVLVRAGLRPFRVLVATGLLGVVVGVGAVVFLVAEASLGVDPRAVVPYAVGFSAGSFLHVAVTDLLPDLHRTGAQKHRQLAALVGGLALVLALRLALPE
jgi:zinc and cadmium transporter